jgi:hypothetical protein
VVRSARAILPLVTLLPLSGCVTTQQRNERATLSATRLLASRQPLVVTSRSRDVRVGHVTLVRGSGGTAVVVALANGSTTTLTDLPISVGVLSGRRRIYLNRRGGLDYFQSHVAAIGAQAKVNWVFTTSRRLPRGARPFARVGAPATPAVSHATGLPGILASPLPSSLTRGGVRVHLRNSSQIPQYGLQVYALARRGARYVAAGRATVAHVGTRAATTVQLKLIGSARGASVQSEALPTIFQ